MTLIFLVPYLLGFNRRKVSTAIVSFSLFLSYYHLVTGGGIESCFESRDRNISTEKYIMQSYFAKYDSLQDSHFATFRDHELSCGDCHGIPRNANIVPRIAVLEQSLIGLGSHRRLSLTIKADVQPDLVSQLSKDFCEMIYVQKLPSGVFADPFELQHLVQRRVFTDAAVFGETNLELPSFLSNRSLVEIHMDIGLNILSRLANGIDITIELPLHARYPPLVESGYSKVQISVPEFFMRCRSEKSDLQSCLLKMNDINAESRSEVIWSIPSGIEKQAQLVYVVTVMFAILSTLLIVLTSIYSSDMTSCKK